MTDTWPSLNYDDWSACRDTLHALTQLLGKFAVALAPPEPQLQHAALRLTARGWETAPLPAPDRSGAIVVALDLTRHEAVLEHTAGTRTAVALASRPVAQITRDVLAEAHRVAGDFAIDLTPQEVSWTAPLDADEEHAGYEPAQAGRYFTAATQAALVLAEYRAPFRGRGTPVNAWWGSFDLAVNLFSGRPAAPPSTDFIMRNAMDAEEVAVGWWPGDERYREAAFYAYAHPAPAGFSAGELAPAAARWEPELGEFVLDWRDVVAAADPRADALAFARSAFSHACAVCGWDQDLAATVHSVPPPIR
jgi:Family of unknown function (DUF5996)